MKLKYIFSIILFLSFTTVLSASIQKELFFSAEKCYNSLDNNKKKFSHNWHTCIKEFKKAYKKDKKGNYAPISLFYVAKLYKELFSISCLASDKKNATSNFTLLVKSYPNSLYTKKAIKNYSNFISKKKRKVAYNKSAQNHSYFTGINCYEMLLRKKKKRENDYLFCIEKFKNAYQDNPDGGYASATLFQMTRLYSHLNKSFPDNRYANETYDNYTKLITKFPKSKYTKEIRGKIKVKKPVSYPKNSIKAFRFWSGPKYTRVVLEIDNKTKFSYKLTDKKGSASIRVNVKNVQISPKVKKYIKIDDTLLDSASFTQGKKTATLLLNIKNFEDYKIFSLDSPYRIVVDIWKKRADKKQDTILDSMRDVARNENKHALLKQLALGVKKIVVDAGHGGIDVGALGIIKKTYEKTITLQIAHRVKSKLEKDLGCEVVMTRDRDKTLSLEARTAIANKEGADLFISIHTNANHSKYAYGIETYFLSLTTDDSSVSVAARENAISERSIGDLEMILSNLMKNSKINESKVLAEYVQKNMYNKLKRKYSKIRNKGVKQAPFYVLVGARMPSILIETSFISNKRECKRLKRADYQEDIATGIVSGIKEYIAKL